MREKLMSILCTAAIFSMAVCACGSKENPSGGDSSVLKLKATLSTYKTSTGTVLPLWESGDKVRVWDATSSSSASADAVGRGSSVATFTMKMDNLADKDALVVYKGASELKFNGTEVGLDIPALQDGADTAPLMIGYATHSASRNSGDDVVLKAAGSLVVIAIPKCDAQILGLTLTTNGGENIAGDVVFDAQKRTYSASSSSASVRFSTPLDCNDSDKFVPVRLAPAMLSKGFNVRFQIASGSKVADINVDDPTELHEGESIIAGTTSRDLARKLMACGSSKVFLFNTFGMEWSDNYKKGLIWSWDCTSAQATCSGAKSSSHIDDVVLVNGGKQLLVTCSNNGGWCMLLEPDYSRDGVAQVLFWTNSSPNAHSAEYLPGGYVAVACSVDGGDCIQLYDIHQNNVPLEKYPLVSAHGAVWNEANKRFYAIGETSLQIYKWNTTTYRLELENTISTSSYVSGLHDLTLVDDNTLVLGGYKAALYDISANRFTALSWFGSSATNGIKSINYNKETQEVYYTFAVKGTAEGAYDWSSHKARYTSTPNVAYNATMEKHYDVSDINMYKVRVYNW